MLAHNDVVAIIATVNEITARINGVQLDINAGLEDGRIISTFGISDIVNWRDDIRMYNACIDTLANADIMYIESVWKAGRTTTHYQRAYPLLTSFMPHAEDCY